MTIRIRAAAPAALAVGMALTWTSVAHADAPPAPTPANQAEIAKTEAFLKSLHPIHGDLAVPGAGATLHLGHGFYFLDAADARRVLIEGWGNPPDAVQAVRGMVFPAGHSPLSDTWGAVVTYQPEGYVPDADAKTTNYDALLQRMRKGQEQIDAQRAKDNVPQVHLVGWAQPPIYDPASHALIWARELKVDGAKVDTLNYDIRELGRRGVLSLNMVSAMPDLAQVHAAAADLGAAASFDPGARYGDYHEGVDKRAAYGVAGLIAAGAGVALAQKAGLLALGLLFLKKGLVVVAAAGAGLFARLRNRVRRKTPQA